MNLSSIKPALLFYQTTMESNLAPCVFKRVPLSTDITNVV